MFNVGVECRRRTSTSTVNTQLQVGPDSRASIAAWFAEREGWKTRRGPSLVSPLGGLLSKCFSDDHYSIPLQPTTNNTIIHLHPPTSPSPLPFLSIAHTLTRRLLTNTQRRILSNPPPPCTLYHPTPFTWQAHHLYHSLTLPQVHLPPCCRARRCRSSPDPIHSSRDQLPVLDPLSFPHIPPVKIMARRRAEE